MNPEVAPICITLSEACREHIYTQMASGTRSSTALHSVLIATRPTGAVSAAGLAFSSSLAAFY